jgi:hypothetical protein
MGGLVRTAVVAFSKLAGETVAEGLARLFLMTQSKPTHRAVRRRLDLGQGSEVNDARTAAHRGGTRALGDGGQFRSAANVRPRDRRHRGVIAQDRDQTALNFSGATCDPRPAVDASDDRRALAALRPRIA